MKPFQTIGHYLTTWLALTRQAFLVELTNRFSSLLFLVGKTVRFLMFLFILDLVVKKTQVLAGYTWAQAVFFYLTFNLIDITAQLFFRGIYHFRFKILSGEFDFFLLKPLNPLFLVLTSHTDLLDLITLIPLLFYTTFFASRHFSPSPLQLVLFLLLFFNGLIIALAIHIIVAAVGILTLEVDHTIWVYRDLSKMARFPVEIYPFLLRQLLTFVVPIAVMINFPAKAFFGLLSPAGLLFAFLAAALLLFFSLRLWRFALTRYTSASS